MTTLLVFSIVCTLIFSLPYGLHRTRLFFGLGRREMAGWFRPTGQLALWVLPVALGTAWLARGLQTPYQLSVNLLVTGLWGGVTLLRHGLGEQLQAEIISRAPVRLKSVFKWLMPA
jgi:hypothetical protein